MPTHTIEHSAPHASAAPEGVGAPPPGRRDLYAPIHKALRLFMTRTLSAVGSTDPADAQEVRATLVLLERLLALCEAHLHHENEFVHPALERARKLPGTTNFSYEGTDPAGSRWTLLDVALVPPPGIEPGSSA